MMAVQLAESMLLTLCSVFGIFAAYCTRLCRKPLNYVLRVGYDIELAALDGVKALMGCK